MEQPPLELTARADPSGVAGPYDARVGAARTGQHGSRLKTAESAVRALHASWRAARSGRAAARGDDGSRRPAARRHALDALDDVDGEVRALPGWLGGAIAGGARTLVGWYVTAADERVAPVLEHMARPTVVPRVERVLRRLDDVRIAVDAGEVASGTVVAALRHPDPSRRDAVGPAVAAAFAPVAADIATAATTMLRTVAAEATDAAHADRLVAAASVDDHVDLLRRAITARSRRAGLATCRDTDRHAPVSVVQRPGWAEWSCAERIVLRAFGDISSELQARAEAAMVAGRVVATARGVSGGHATLRTPWWPARAQVDFDGSAATVGTVAHEVAHLVHADLARDQPLRDYRAATVVAEAVAILVEITCLERVSRDAGLDAPARAVVWLDTVAGSLLRHAQLVRFGARLSQHAATHPLSELDCEREWHDAGASVYGHAVVLGPHYPRWWPLGLEGAADPSTAHYPLAVLLAVAVREQARLGADVADGLLAVQRRGALAGTADVLALADRDELAVACDDAWRVIERMVATVERAPSG